MLRSLPAVLVLALVSPALAQPLPLTPAQTEGPYYPSRIRPADTDADLTRIGLGPRARGEIIALEGRVVDPAGRPIEGARIQIWQTDSQGIYLHPDDPNTARHDRNFQFYGRARSAADGAFRFLTILPARYPGRPPHIHAKITPPGGNTLTTQFYFAGDDLSGDGVARRLGKALDSVTLRLESAADGARAAQLRIVVPRGQ